MFTSIWDDIKSSFRTGNMVTRLVLINFIVFVAVNLCKFIFWMVNAGHGIPAYFDDGLSLLCMPAHWQELIWHPWGLFTYMFLHEGLWHVLNNIIFLYLFGTIVGDLIGDRRVLPIYLLGGLAGAVLFMLSDFWMHYMPPYALGASGAVMALAGAAVTLAPDYRVMLILLGEVKLKYIVLVMLLLDLVGIANDDNTGGHIAHLGGFFTGIFIISRLQDGADMLEPVNRILNRIHSWFDFGKNKKTSPRRQPEMAYRKGGAKSEKANNKSDSNLSFQEQLDAILDKIRENGYDNLTQEEKDFLYNASKRK